tara:strand:- start:116 stop:496 length:381 start_codon:yes stop_codon:yes gene_type:complete
MITMNLITNTDLTNLTNPNNGKSAKTMKLLGDNFYEQGFFFESEGNELDALHNYAAAWVFYRQCENDEKMADCDVRLVFCGVNGLDAWHSLGEKTLKISRKYMYSLAEEELPVLQNSLSELYQKAT